MQQDDGPKTCADLIRALGGTALVADTLGVVHSAVRNWRTRNAIPPRHYLALYDMAEASGVPLERNLFKEIPAVPPEYWEDEEE